MDFLTRVPQRGVFLPPNSKLQLGAPGTSLPIPGPLLQGEHGFSQLLK